MTTRTYFAISTALMIVLVCVDVADAQVTLTGTIGESTSPWMPLPGFLVEVRKVNPYWFDDSIGFATTGSGGLYTLSTSAVAAGDQVYVRGKWQIPLGSNYNDRLIKLISYKDAGGNVVSYTDKDSSTLTLSATTLPIQMPNVHMDQDSIRFPVVAPGNGDCAYTSSLPASLKEQVIATLDYVRTHKDGSTPWAVTQDIPVYVLQATENSWTSPSDQSLHLSCESFDLSNPDPKKSTSIYHEAGHLVYLQAGCSGVSQEGHTFNTYSSEAVAFTEGWAECMHVLVGQAKGRDTGAAAVILDDGAFVVGTGTAAIHPFPARTLWRGDSANSTATTPFGTTIGATAWRAPGTPQINGAMVEGAVAASLYELASSTTVGFGRLFGALVGGQPSTFFSLRERFVSYNGTGDPKVTFMHAVIQEHGVFYNRMRLQDQAIVEGQPSYSGTADTGNCRLIGSNVFVRGQLPVWYNYISDIGTDHRLEPKKVQVGWKTALPGLNNNITSMPSTWGAAVDYVPWPNSNMPWDTTAVGTGDGAYDLLIRCAENEDGAVDTLYPTWDGDGTTSVDSDEKYLKMIRAWYDRDGDPATEADGQVNVDNTPPQVFAVWPPAN